MTVPYTLNQLQIRVTLEVQGFSDVNTKGKRVTILRSNYLFLTILVP